MRHLKITNILLPGGVIDYKGLDIEQFVPGSQVYPHDTLFALVATEQEDIPTHPDVIELTEQQYNDEVADVIANMPPPETETEQRLADLEIMMADLILGGVS